MDRDKPGYRTDDVCEGPVLKSEASVGAEANDIPNPRSNAQRSQQLHADAPSPSTSLDTAGEAVQPALAARWMMGSGPVNPTTPALQASPLALAANLDPGEHLHPHGDPHDVSLSLGTSRDAALFAISAAGQSLAIPAGPRALNCQNSLRTQPGSNFGIETLPQELVGVIFGRTLPSIQHIGQYNYSQERRSAVQSLRLVSRLWNAFVERTPEFWTFINSGDPPAWIEACLQRSGDSLLTVEHGSRSNKPGPVWGQPCMIPFSPETLQATHRWRWMSYDIHDECPFPIELVTRRMEQLRTLEIRTSEGGRLPQIISSAVPHLSRLVLGCEGKIKVKDWHNLSKLTTLLELEISISSAHGSLGLTALFEALRELQGLERLSLSYDPPRRTSDPDEIHTPNEFITLPALRSLRVKSSQEKRFLTSLLGALRTPGLKDGEFHYLFGFSAGDDDIVRVTRSIAGFLKNFWGGIDVRAHGVHLIRGSAIKIVTKPGPNIEEEIRFTLWCHNPYTVRHDPEEHNFNTVLNELRERGIECHCE